MKRIVLAVTFILLATWGCNGQVQVPSANVQPILDSLAALKVRVATLEAKPSANIQPLLDSISALRGRVATLESQAVQTKSGLVTFAANEWRKAVYLPGINSSWRGFVSGRTTVNNPVFGFLDKIVKTDSLVVLCEQGGPARQVDWLCLFP